MPEPAMEPPFDCDDEPCEAVPVNLDPAARCGCGKRWDEHQTIDEFRRGVRHE
jgi:hypothetical protein